MIGKKKKRMSPGGDERLPPHRSEPPPGPCPRYAADDGPEPRADTRHGGLVRVVAVAQYAFVTKILIQMSQVFSVFQDRSAFNLTGNLADAHVPIATNHLGRTRAVAARVGGGLGVPSRADRGRNLPQWSKNR